MSTRSILLVPADRATNVELVPQVATALAAPGPAEVHILDVKPRAESWRAHLAADFVGSLKQSVSATCDCKGPQGKQAPSASSVCK